MCNITKIAFLSSIFYYCLFSISSGAAILVQSPGTFVTHYEYLDYDTKLIIENHERQRRSAQYDSWIEIWFRSHERLFHLRLEPDNSVFSKDHLLDVNGRNDDKNTLTFLFQGSLKDDPYSYVYGSVLDGIFDGHIYTGNGKLYHIEKASRYFGHNRQKQFHSIIYEDSAIDHSKIRQLKRRAVPSQIYLNTDDLFPATTVKNQHCALNGAVKQELENIQNSALGSDFKHGSETNVAYFKKRNADKLISDQPEPEIINGKQVYAARTCTLYIQVDQTLYRHVYNNEGGKDKTRTLEEIVALISNHIKAVSYIFRKTDFDGITGINFMVQRTSIWDETSCPGTKNPFCRENVDVANYLDLLSQNDQSLYCLAIAITYRDFLEGTLGLAYLASPLKSGGICDTYRKHYWGSRSLNTGIVTLVNYGERVPPRVSQLTLTHEIAHGFGSPHDFPSECKPGPPDGNYIMFESATSGHEINNAKFSSCSIRNISKVLFSVLKEKPVDPEIDRSSTGRKRNCFFNKVTEFCGNKIKEPNEQCDCGFTEKDCQRMNDKCCYPRISNNILHPHRCTKINTAKCSPSEGVCCDPNTCTFRTKNYQCRGETECAEKQYCTGSDPVCHASLAKPASTTCQDNTKLCDRGMCNSSICSHLRSQECFYLPKGDKEKKRWCELACDINGICTSSFELPALAKYYQKQTGNKGILLMPGSPCDNYRGYCDTFGKCRQIDGNGPLFRITNILFGQKTLETITEWMETRWWAVILMGIGLLVFMALFIKCCAVHTPSTNPRNPPAHKFSQTLRRPDSAFRRPRVGRDECPRACRHSIGVPAQADSQSAGNENSSFDIPGGSPLSPGPPPINAPAAGTAIEPPPSYNAVLRSGAAQLQNDAIQRESLDERDIVEMKHFDKHKY